MKPLFLFLFLLGAFSVQGQPELSPENYAPNVKGANPESPQSQRVQNAGNDREAALNRERLEATQAISGYTERILEVETEEGPNSYALSELLLGLGDAYSQLNNREMALQSYKRALHIYRINNGLHDLGQKPLLERVLKTSAELNDHADLNNHYDYLLWLYRRNYDSEDPKLLPALIRSASWKLKAFADNPGSDRVGRLYEAEELFEQSLNILETSSGMDDSVALEHLFDIAEANMEAQFFSGSAKFVEEALQNIIDRHNQNPKLSEASLAEAWVMLGDWEMSVEDSRDAIEHYQRAYQTLTNNKEVSPDVTQRLFARPHPINTLDTEAILERGGFDFSDQPGFSTQSRFSTYHGMSSRDGLTDYSQFLRRNKLSSHGVLSSRYGGFSSRGGVYTHTHFHRHNSLSEKQLRSDVIAPGKHQLDKADIQDLNLENTPYVLVELDVSEEGRVKDLEILESNPSGSARFRRDAREIISELPFRPRLDKGEPVATNSFIMLFRFE